MSRIGFIGLGKLGFPVALAIESKGHKVVGYDINPNIKNYVADKKYPFREEGLQELLDKTNIEIAESIAEVVEESDIVFCPVQTPHHPRYDGAHFLPQKREDFDYSYLRQVVFDIAHLQKPVTLAVISTCLPGTFNREIEPIIKDTKVEYVYTPQFIAMGTVIDDYLNPEFNLIGARDPDAVERLVELYDTINDAEPIITDITTAEGIKVSYNTWITAKTVLANTWGELSHRIGMNFDDIKRAWDLSTKRLISNRYMDSGVGDGGGCHPRDNIALSYIADDAGMSHNIWDDLMIAREDHMGFIADEAMKHGDRVTILGKAFKPETDMVDGSPAVLLARILREKGATVNHVNEIDDWNFGDVIIIGTKNERYRDIMFLPETVVIDPFRYLDNQESATIIPIGKPSWTLNNKYKKH